MIALLHDFLCYFYAILFAIPTLALILQYNYLQIDIINDQLLRKLDHFLFKESSLFVVIAIYCFSSIFSSTVGLQNLWTGGVFHHVLCQCKESIFLLWLRWLNRVMQDHEAHANDVNRKLIFSFFLLFS